MCRDMPPLELIILISNFKNVNKNKKMSLNIIVKTRVLRRSRSANTAMNCEHKNPSQFKITSCTARFNLAITGSRKTSKDYYTYHCNFFPLYVYISSRERLRYWIYSTFWFWLKTELKLILMSIHMINKSPDKLLCNWRCGNWSCRMSSF